MIERLEVPCPTCGESGFTLGKIWNQGEWVNTHVVCSACHGEKVVPESDAAYIERMKRVIDELAASKQENGNLFDRLRMMAQEVTGRDCDIERLEAELAIERERREKAEALLKVAAGTCAFLFWSDIDSCPADHVDPEIWDCEEKDCAKNIDGVVACWVEYFDARREYNLRLEAEKGAGDEPVKE